MSCELAHRYATIPVPPAGDCGACSSSACPPQISDRLRSSQAREGSVITNNRYTRRHFLTHVGSGTVVAAAGLNGQAWARTGPVPPQDVAPDELARDEAFWRSVGEYYDRADGILNLEHGYWSTMARPVQDRYIEALRMVNAQTSFYARKGFADDAAEATRRVAQALGAHADEIVLTRNATEACQNLIRQYQGLGPSDAVLLADVDYPMFKQLMHWLGDSRGVRVVEVPLPGRADQAQIRDLYLNAFDANPDLRLMLITHVSNQHGLVVPVAEIAAEAKRRGIDVICDAAQSWGLLDFRVADLGADWVAFNLHKWIGAPLGNGALYMRRGTLDKIAPYPGERDATTAARIQPGTINFASRLAVPAAFDFHETLGPANKEARLRYLRSLWTDEAERMSHIEVLGGLDEASRTGIASFRLHGKTTVEDAEQLQRRMEEEFGIFTVIRKGLASGACVRITPHVFTSADDIGRAVEALGKFAD